MKSQILFLLFNLIATLGAVSQQNHTSLPVSYDAGLSKKLIIAGPFMDDQPLRGIFIFDVTTIDEARQLTSTDPAIKAGTLVMELHPWYGPATLKEIPKLQKQIQKRGFDE